MSYKKNSDQKDLDGTGLVPQIEKESDVGLDSGNKSKDENYFVVNGVHYEKIQRDDGDVNKEKLLDLTNVPTESEQEDSSASSEDEGVQKDLWLPASEPHCNRPAWGKKPKTPTTCSCSRQHC